MRLPVDFVMDRIRFLEEFINNHPENKEALQAYYNLVEKIITLQGTPITYEGKSQYPRFEYTYPIIINKT